MKYALILAWFGLLGYAEAKAQELQVSDSLQSGTLQVNRVLIMGNKVTRDRIILRELSLKPGDTIRGRRIDEVLILDRNKIYNLGLFNTVKVSRLPFEDGKVDIVIEVSERWYTFPNPIFELSDRNVNEWWENYGHDFKRVNYGIRHYQNNFRGRNEKLRLTAQFGYIRKFQLSYSIPNIGKSQKHGLTFYVDYGEPKNMAYATVDHKLEYLEARSTLKTTFGSQVTYAYRKSFYETHAISLEYRKSGVADTIPMLNPNYYSNGASEQMFTALSYSFNSEHRDVVAYPLKGYQFTGFISKVGLGLGDNVNILESNLTFAYHADLKKGFYFSNFTAGFFSTPKEQPYSMYSALGYRRQFLRGYEIYVIEGPQFFVNKTTFKKRIFSRAWSIEDFPIEQFKYFPLSIYLKASFDFGYVQNYERYRELLKVNTAFTDKWLTGSGVGLDVVILYDNVFRFEYNFTSSGTHGFFFHIKREF